MKKLLLRNFQSPGDVLLLTAAVRDLHAAHPGKYMTAVETSAGQIWENNPHINFAAKGCPDTCVIQCEYPIIHQSKVLPYHFINGFRMDLETKLGIQIPAGPFKGDIHLSSQECSWTSQVEETGYKGPWIVMMAGGKADFTAKWPNPKTMQAVVDHFKDRILFVQCGEASHNHRPLNGVLNLIGKTDTRQFIRLVYNSYGVITPSSFAMHLAAAVPPKPGLPHIKPCIVIAGSREENPWQQYLGHQLIHRIGMLPCCQHGGCWKSRATKMNDGDAKDIVDLCENRVEAEPGLEIAKCVDMIKPNHIIELIEMWFENGVLKYNEPGK